MVRVPKADLVTVTQLALQQQRVQWHESLQFGPVFAEELKNMVVDVTKAGRATFETPPGNRDGDHDDLVFAAAIALWVAERGLDALSEVDGGAVSAQEFMSTQNNWSY